jgi:hypothetical protein
MVNKNSTNKEKVSAGFFATMRFRRWFSLVVSFKCLKCVPSSISFYDLDDYSGCALALQTNFGGINHRSMIFMFTFIAFVHLLTDAQKLLLDATSVMGENRSMV